MKSKRITAILCATAVACSACGFMLCGCGVGADAPADITAWEVPDKYRAERTEGGGEVVELKYVTRDYVTDSGKTEEKALNVYLPNGYAADKNYNVIYLLHGTDPQTVDHKRTWLYTIGVKDVLDNMIFYGDIDPVIVVTPSFYSYGLYGDDDMKNIKDFSQVKVNSSDNFGYELRNDIIPAVESRYSTYAEDVTEAGLIASRDHRAMAGLSNGARITYIGGMTQNFDYISYFGCYSASVDSKLITDALDGDRFGKYKLNYMFNADGIYDFAYNSHKKMYDALVKTDRFTDDNSEYVEIAFGYHSARSWRVAFYDSLQRFFK